MKTIIKGYDKNNKIVVTKTVDYNDRYNAINAIMNNEKITHITLKNTFFIFLKKVVDKLIDLCYTLVTVKERTSKA